MSDFGQSKLINHFKENGGLLSRDECLAFFTHPSKPNRYRALANLVAPKKRLIKKYINHEPYYGLASNAAIIVPEPPKWSSPSGFKWMQMFILAVRYGKQQHKLIPRQRFITTLRHLLLVWKPCAQFILAIDWIVNSNPTQEDYDTMEKAIIDKGYEYDSERNVRDSLPVALPILQSLGTKAAGITDEALATLEDWNDNSELRVDINYPKKENED